MKFEEEPDYKYIIKIFTDLLLEQRELEASTVASLEQNTVASTVASLEDTIVSLEDTIVSLEQEYEWS